MPKITIDLPRLTVFVIDDQDYVRSIIVQLLRRLGVGKVHECDGGPSALETMRDIKPDLIFCDIRMKPMDGLQFLREVRNGKSVADAAVPVIFLTSASDRNTVEEAIKEDVSGYMVKPVSANDLKDKIISVMTKRLAKGAAW
ncbi:MAG TPA: response regulator [Rhodospirillaceae bacterium]|nr:response regulator [Rhodospirillaceae bacterium]